MNKDFSQTPRPTFKRALRRISVISVVISMTLVWLLLSTASIFTLKQYAQKILSSLPRPWGAASKPPGIWRQRGGRGDPRVVGQAGQISQQSC